jgi:hypothetical protein
VFAIAPDNLHRTLSGRLVREAVGCAMQPDDGVDAVGRLGEGEDHFRSILALETSASFGGGGLCLGMGDGSDCAERQQRDERAMDG